jgi:hypothetical protein
MRVRRAKARWPSNLPVHVLIDGIPDLRWDRFGFRLYSQAFVQRFLPCLRTRGRRFIGSGDTPI